MTQMITALAEISPAYDAVLCDLWGCLHNGMAPFPAAVAALQQFRRNGGKVVLLTNAPRPSRFVIDGLDRMGVPRDAWDLVVSSGDAAQDAMFSGAVGRRVWHLGPPKDEGFFTAVPPEWAAAPPIARVPLAEAEAIVCTGPFEELTEVPEDYRARLLFAKARGLPMLCANPDLVVDMGSARIYCAGALAALYEEMGGAALYFGKPHPPIYDLAMRRLEALGGVAEARVLAIGDGIGTDVAGAAGEGLDVLFITSGLAAAEFGPDPEHPDPKLLARWLVRQMQAPGYAAARLR
ncbi:TIGR01459 family HAD-type hydrolase [Phaeovulum sp.]|uniref:TIGR01459 family HAD-type hydrolase n=1 Tax=Phaeovulum sp. TaxID=2934796 RepID=UPI00272FAC6F|nr:TIGR01459 family HAD-type hydrolase [Phaeovulum sp.]MDP1668356.1 TIGR01459 family HAD-type hydrolase [Phaeovulum sp.]MDZ4117947.1 TIGR01459 family HAD-type hydrolase [Phaeovulum sp.]